jgi:hypothetical protein
MDLFNVAAGVYVPNQWKLIEGFKVIPSSDTRTKIQANVSLEHLDPFFRATVHSLAEPVLLIFEIPCNITIRWIQARDSRVNLRAIGDFAARYGQKFAWLVDRKSRHVRM